MAWTPERVEKLTKLWNDGLSASQVAAELGGVTRNAVIGKVHRLGLSGRSKTTTNSRPKAKRSPAANGTRKPARKGNVSARQNGSRGNAVSVATPSRATPTLEEPASRKLRLEELTEHTCRWPHGDPQEHDFSFCGHKPNSASPYCEYHYQLAYQSTSDRKHTPNKPTEPGASPASS